MNSSIDYRYLPPQLAEQIRSFRITVQRPVHGQREGLHRSPNYGSSVEFAEYREYTPGDPINLIDWAVYARTDKYVIRRFHEETNLRAYIMLDTSRSLSFKDRGPMSKMEYASYLAAGLMFIFVNQGDTVSLVTFDTKLRTIFEPVGTVEGIRPLLQKLESMGPAGESNIESAIHEAAEMVPPRSLIVIISDLLENTENLMRGIRHLHHNGHNIMVLHVMDKGERNLSFTGVTELRDLETGDRMIVEADEIQHTYDDAVSRYLASLKAGFSECMTDYHLIDTDTPIERSLYDLQDKAMLRGR